MTQSQNKKLIAEDKIAYTLITTTNLWLKLKSFYEITNLGLSSGVNEHMRHSYNILDNLVQTGELARFLYDPNDDKEMLRLYKQGAAKIHQTTLEKNQRIVDSACIVFAHGILEECIYGYLTATAIGSPENWEAYVIKKTVELGTIKSESFEQILEAKIKRLLQSDVKRESLISKLDRLHQIAPPTQDTKQMLVTYDRDRLIRFDDTRQDIVHGNDWSSYLFDFGQEWDYWWGLNFYFACLVCSNTDLKISTKICGQYWKDSFRS